MPDFDMSRGRCIMILNKERPLAPMMQLRDAYLIACDLIRADGRGSGVTASFASMVCVTGTLLSKTRV